MQQRGGGRRIGWKNDQRSIEVDWGVESIPTPNPSPPSGEGLDGQVLALPLQGAMRGIWGRRGEGLTDMIDDTMLWYGGFEKR